MKPKPIDEHRTKSPLRRALTGLAGRLGFAYYDMLYSQSDMDRPGQPTRNSAKVKANPAEAGDLEIVTARLSEDSKYWFDQSLKAGSVCYVGRHEDQIIGYVFANHRAVLMLGKELKKLPEGFVFIHNAYIFAEFRGKGLFTVFLTKFRPDLRSQGNRHIASLVDRENAASIGSGLNFGARRERAPILCVPGFKPIVLGKGFRMMREVVKERSKGRASPSTRKSKIEDAPAKLHRVLHPGRILLNPKPLDEQRIKSPIRHALSGWAGRLGFAYYDILYAQTDLTQPIRLARSRVEVESASDRDRESIAAGLPEVPKYWFDRAIEAGSVCYVARREGQIAGYTFANPRVILMLEDELESLPEGFAFFHNAYIFPEFRGKGLYPIVMGQFYTLLRSQGIRYVAGLVDRKNRPALGAGQHFAIRRESAPILYLPGLKPIVLGKGFRMMREVAKERPRG